MDQKTLIKWALIAVGGYLVYRWLSTSGLFGTATASVAPATGTTAPITAGTTAGTPAVTTTPVVPVTVVPTPPATTPAVSALMQAAGDQSKVGVVGDYLLTPWQWNYYRQQYFTTVLNQPFDKATMTPDFPAGVDPSSPVTASAYWAILRNIGLSGLGWSGGVAYGYHPGGSNFQ